MRDRTEVLRTYFHDQLFLKPVGHLLQLLEQFHQAVTRRQALSTQYAREDV